MPLSYKNNVEARADLLQKSKEWRASFNALSSTKTVGLKDMATTMTSMVDCVTSQQNFIHEAMGIQDKRIKSLDKGVELSQRMGNQACGETEENRGRIEALEKKTRELQLETELTSRKAKTSLTAAQLIQLERSQNVLIVRGIRPEKREEKYEDMERAFYRMLHKLKLDGNTIKVNYLRRLPRSRGSGWENPLRCEWNSAVLETKLEYSPKWRKS